MYTENRIRTYPYINSRGVVLLGMGQQGVLNGQRDEAYWQMVWFLWGWGNRVG